MKKIVTLLTLLCLSVWANAERVEIDGIWYKLEATSQTAEVTYSRGINYSGIGIIVIPETVTYEDVVYSVTSIGTGAFWSAHSLTSITIPNSVTSIGDFAFNKCPLTSIRVEDGNTVYDSREECNAIIETATNTLIYGCQSTVIPYSVTNIGCYAFYDCSNLTNITIPNSVRSIEPHAFSGCTNLTSIIIPNSVRIIGTGAFCFCSNLISINIGKFVRNIELHTFSCCKIYKFYSHATEVPFIYDEVFQDSGIESATLYVPSTAINDYKATEPWSRFGSIKSLTDE